MKPRWSIPPLQGLHRPLPLQYVNWHRNVSLLICSPLSRVMQSWMKTFRIQLHTVWCTFYWHKNYPTTTWHLNISTRLCAFYFIFVSLMKSWHYGFTPGFPSTHFYTLPGPSSLVLCSTLMLTPTPISLFPLCEYGRLPRGTSLSLAIPNPIMMFSSYRVSHNFFGLFHAHLARNMLTTVFSNTSVSHNLLGAMSSNEQ